MDSPRSAPRPAARNSLDWLATAILIAVTLLFGCREITGGGLGWSDAPQHMMNGAFVRDAVREMPLGRLRPWAEDFYLRHPAIGIIVYWPPGFGMVEAAFFAMAGVSIAVARFAVVAMAAGAVVLLYLLASRWFDRRTGLFAALMLLACPHGQLWLTDVLVEWPAMFWILLTVWLYFRCRDSGRAWAAFATAGAFVMAVLTKQTAGFIGLVLLVHALLDPLARARMKRPASIVSGLLAGCVLAGYFLFARHYAGLTTRLIEFDASDPFYYFSKLGETAGWPMTLLAAAGILSLIRSRQAPAGGLLPLWFLAWTGFASLIAAKEPRYFFFALPPLAVWAASCAGVYLARVSVGAVATALVAGLMLVSAWRSPPARLPRYDAAVHALLDRGDADLVLIDGVRDGQFVVDAYVDPVARSRIIPLRASKLLYARPARERFGLEEFVHSPQDVRQLLDRYGIRYVVMESALPRTEYAEADPPARAVLRETVADQNRFELLAVWPLRCTDPAWNDVELRLYRYRNCPPRTASQITLPIPGMSADVTIALPPASQPN